MSEREDRIAALTGGVTDREIAGLLICETLTKLVDILDCLNDRLDRIEQIPDIKRHLDRARQEGREG